MRPEGLHRHQADDLVAAVLVDGKIRVAARDDLAPVHLLGVLEVEEDDLRPGRHERRHRQLVQRQHALDHLLLRPLEHAGVEALLHQRPDLVLAHGLRRRPGAQPDQPGDAVGRQLQHAQKRRRQPGQPAHRAREPRRHLFRMRPADALGNQLAEQQHERRQAEGHRPEGEGRRVGLQDGEPGDFRGQLPGEPGPAEHAGDHAGKRQPELHEGEEPRRVLRQRERLGGAIAVVGRQFAQPRLAGRDHRRLRHGEQAVGQHQQADDEQFERDAGHGRPAKLARPAGESTPRCATPAARAGRPRPPAGGRRRRGRNPPPPAARPPPAA